MIYKFFASLINFNIYTNFIYLKLLGINMARGRPIGSQIRQNIVEILYFMKTGYGYEIFKAYKNIFPKVTMRVIYYHLKKGQQTGEFKIDRIEKEKGNYSWGPEAEKTYYKLGRDAKPAVNPLVREYFEKKG